MPAIQRGQAYRLGRGRWGLRYYDRDGKRRRKSPFPTKSAALRHYRDVIEPELRGDRPTRDLTLAELVELYLERHAAAVRPRTIATLRERLRHARGRVRRRAAARARADGARDRRLAAPRCPSASRYGDRAGAAAGARRRRALGLHGRNPAKLAGTNPQAAAASRARLHARRARRDRRRARRPPTGRCRRSPPRPGCGPRSGRRSSAATSTARAGVLNVRRTVSSGEVVELGKTTRQRRQVPLSRGRSTRSTRCRRGSTRRCCSRRRAAGCSTSTTSAAASGRRRSRRPASASPRASTTCARRSPRTRSPPASTVFELARIMGTSDRDDRAPLRHAARRRRRAGSPAGSTRSNGAETPRQPAATATRSCGKTKTDEM